MPQTDKVFLTDAVEGMCQPDSFSLFAVCFFCRTLFEVVLFEECTNQWSLSRPMLSLILINEQIYNDLKVRAVASVADVACTQVSCRMRSLVLINKQIYNDLKVRAVASHAEFSCTRTICSMLSLILIKEPSR